ncbi:MAG: hypothetical protein K9M45_06855, partial [Kiritimatiellales bacterium]|nr:hypothetical protein [Kiritimatiellales bacterium]
MVGRKALCTAVIFFAVQAFGYELFDVSTAKGNAKPADCRIQKKGDALKLEYGHKSQWPSVHFSQDKIGYSSDWSEYALLAITLSNPTAQPVESNIRLDSAAVKGNKGRNFHTTVLPGQKLRLLMPFAGREPIIGMRGQPPLLTKQVPGDVLLGHNGTAVDPSNIQDFQIFLARPETDNTLLL